MKHKMDQSGDRLSAALRELAALERQGASPEAGLMLQDAFRRHHLRRKRMLTIRAGLIGICVAGLAASFLLRKPAVKVTPQTTVQIISPEEVSDSPAVSASKIRRAAPAGNNPATSNASAVSAFVALPSSVVLPPVDELRVVRLEMRGEDLRLVGAPVTEEIAARRITADFVVGHDGTPYAMRLVRSNF